MYSESGSSDFHRISWVETSVRVYYYMFEASTSRQYPMYELLSIAAETLSRHMERTQFGLSLCICIMCLDWLCDEWDVCFFRFLYSSFCVFFFFFASLLPPPHPCDFRSCIDFSGISITSVFPSQLSFRGNFPVEVQFSGSVLRPDLVSFSGSLGFRVDDDSCGNGVLFGVPAFPFVPSNQHIQVFGLSPGGSSFTLLRTDLFFLGF